MATTSARSWRVHRLGSPADALRLDELPVVHPGPGEARVRVSAVGLNFPDLLLCSGHYQERPDLPFVPGYEAAGVVAEVGAGSSRRPGDHVIVIPELPNGALQESITVPDGQLYPVPAEVPAPVAATLHIAYATAHAALHRRAGLRDGETVLVDGAAGGVGSAVIQVAKAAGARVIAISTGPEKVRACTRLGADVCVDLALEQDLVGRVRAETGGRGADVVVDVVGGELFDRVRRTVGFEGRVVTVGFTSGTIPQVPVNHVLLRNYALIGLHLVAYRRAEPAVLRAVHDEVIRLHRSGRVEPWLFRCMPFEQAPAALDLLARREVIGRVVLEVRPSRG